MRCDINVSVRPVGENRLRTRAEVKNVNSVRFVMQAIEHEARRQVALYEAGGDGRAGNPAVRFRPRRDPLDAGQGVSPTTTATSPIPTCCRCASTRPSSSTSARRLPELPDQRKQRFIDDYGLTAYDASVLTAEKEASEYFEAVARGRDGKQAANWVITNLFAVLNKQGRSIADLADLGRAPRQAARPDGRRHHLRAAGQGGVRDHGRDRRRSGRHHRGQGAAADHRRRRHRGGGGQGGRRQSRRRSSSSAAATRRCWAGWSAR